MPADMGGVALRHDRDGNDSLYWMGPAREEHAIAVRDLIRRDATTKERIAAMRSRVAKLDAMRDFILDTHEALLHAGSAKRTRAAPANASQPPASASPSEPRARSGKLVCFVCAARVAVSGNTDLYERHLRVCLADAEAICKDFGLATPAVPQRPDAAIPQLAADDAEQQLSQYNAEVERCLAATERPGDDGRGVTIIELGAQRTKARDHQQALASASA